MPRKPCGLSRNDEIKGFEKIKPSLRGVNDEAIYKLASCLKYGLLWLFKPIIKKKAKKE